MSLRRRIRPDQAVEYFRYYVDCYPESANSHDSLGEAYMAAGDTEGAIASYEKSLELNPADSNAEKMPEKLRGGG